MRRPNFELSYLVDPDNSGALANTSGSGKTRLLLDGLCRNWGFYFVAMPDAAGVGSRTFFNLMKNLDRSLDYDVARTFPDDPDSWCRISKKAYHRLVQLLLARFLLLDLFIEEAKNLTDGLHQEKHLRAWVLLQEHPTNVLSQEDIS